MKNTFKRVMAVAMVAVMLAAALCFAGCGSNDKTTYFIGATGPLTGDAADYGIAVNNGAKLAIEEINAAGGLNGVLFDYEMKDDKATAPDAQTGYNALMDAGMQISLGSVTSGSCEAFATEAAKDNLFFMTPSASAANVIADRPNAFRVCFGDPGHGVGLEMHEDPYVCHVGFMGRGIMLLPGMIFTIEPMINEGTGDVYISPQDGWTVYTADHSLSAQVEHEVLVTNDGFEILSK